MLMTCDVKPAPFAQRGISLMEALITIIILAFGILGLANLQAKMQTAEVESYARSQALVMVDDMAARVSANRANAAAYVALAATGNPAGTGDAQPTDCSGIATLADRDVCEWSNALKGSTEQAGGIAVGAMIGGRGCIDQLAGVDPPSFRIAVVWQGLSPTIAPSAGIDCAKAGAPYGGNDAFRRVVTNVVSVASLAPGP
jgi:type IV pilus assembly protein PilV